MNSPAQVLTQKVAHHPSRLQDARKAERLRLSVPIVYTVNMPSSAVTHAARTINVSGGGVQLSVSGEVQPSTPCQVTLHLPDHPAPLTLQGLVRWCRPGRGKRQTSTIGVSFAKPDAPDEDTFTQFCHFVATHLFKKYFKIF